MSKLDKKLKYQDTDCIDFSSSYDSLKYSIIKQLNCEEVCRSIETLGQDEVVNSCRACMYLIVFVLNEAIKFNSFEN